MRVPPDADAVPAKKPCDVPTVRGTRCTQWRYEPSNYTPRGFRHLRLYPINADPIK